MRWLLPPVLLLIFAVLMALVDRVLPGPVLVPPPYHWAGAVLAAMGLGVAVAARVQFRRAGTTVYTFDEPGRLVTHGVFRLSRHPMYLGLSMVLAGWAVGLGSVAPLVLAAVFVLLTDRWYIAFEERALRHKFGPAYDSYAGRTRRWC